MKYLKLFETNNVSKKRKFIEHFYKYRCTKSSDHADSVGWVNRSSQYSRFKIFLKYINNGDIVLDFGCGVGDLFKYLNKKRRDIEYLGVDIQSNMVRSAKEKYPEAKFKVVNDIMDIHDEFNWIVASGVFTVGSNEEDVLHYFKEGYKICKDGIIANFITSKRGSNEISTKFVQTLSGEKLTYTYYTPTLLKEYLEKSLGKKLTLIDNYRKDDFTLVLEK